MSENSIEKQASSKKKPKKSDQDQVVDYMINLENPLKSEIEVVRNIILQTNSQLTENIKWNAPSFSFNNEDRITFNFQGKGFFRLIFHCGAKVNENKSKEPLFVDATGLLEWLDSDRAMVKFVRMQDVEVNKNKLVEVITNWIEAAS